MASGIVTPYATLSFPVLFTPRPRIEGGEPVFSCSLLFSPDVQKSPEFLKLKEAANAAFRDKFPDKKPSGQFATPFRRAEDKDYEGYEEGWVYISPTTKIKPGVIDAARRDILTAEEVWAGQIVRAYVTPFAFEKGANRGVSFGLNGLQIVEKDKPRMDGRVALSSVFDDGKVNAESAMASADDMPF